VLPDFHTYDLEFLAIYLKIIQANLKGPKTALQARGPPGFFQVSPTCQSAPACNDTIV
jgi:hypothetical protein